MDSSEIDSYVKAGEIAREVKEFARGILKPEMKLIDIAEAIDAKILELGGEAAFPVNLSLNEVAAHFTPDSSCDEVAEGLVTVDIGIAVDGFIADTAFSVDLSDEGEFGGMIALNEKVLERASEIVRVGMEVRDVGEAVQGVMEKDGNDFVVIKSLSGHALGRDTIHAGLTISNYRNDNKTKLDDMAFAIEPFVTSGVGDIFEGKGGGIYVLKGEGQVRDRDARRVLDFIRDKYGTRPFCARWLEKEEFSKLKFVLGTLCRQDILYEYPVLIEKSRRAVSQAENTFLISGDRVWCTTG